MKKTIVCTVLLCGMVLMYACKKSTATFTPDCSTTKSFASDVSPLIQSYCATSGCHASGSSNGVGALTTYQQVFNARASVRSSVASGSMPKGSTLSDAQKNAILCWIDSGAPNN